MRRTTVMAIVAAVAVTACGGESAVTTLAETTVPADTTTMPPAQDPVTTTTEATDTTTVTSLECPFMDPDDTLILNIRVQEVISDGDDKLTCSWGRAADVNRYNFTAYRGDRAAGAFDEWYEEWEIAELLGRSGAGAWTLQEAPLSIGEGFVLSHPTDGPQTAFGVVGEYAVEAHQYFGPRVVRSGGPQLGRFRAWLEAVLGNLVAGRW